MRIPKQAKFVLIGVISMTLFYFALTTLLEYRISRFLEQQEVQGMTFTYTDISLKLLQRTATVAKPQVVLNDSLGSVFTGEVTLNTLKIKNINFYKLLINGSLDIDAIELDQLTGKLYKTTPTIKSVEEDTSHPIELNIDISLSHLVLKNTNVDIYDTGEDSLFLSLQNFNLDVTHILINNQTLSKSLPFVCEDYFIQSDTVFLKAGPFENLSIAHINGNHTKTNMLGIRYKNKYSKPEYSALLNEERDYYDIEVDTLILQNTSLQAVTNQKLSLGIEKIHLQNPQIEIYRDKLLEDKNSVKYYYSRILRESSMNISIDTFHFRNAKLAYTEKIKRENQGGEIFFNEMNIDINKLGNTYADDTVIDMNARFMDATPFKSRWTFNVGNTADAFQFDGQIGLFDVNALNRFTEPNLNVDLEGRINQLFFSITGNHQGSNLDLSVNYNHLAVSILNEKTKRKRKFLSSMANMLVSNKSKSADSSFKNVQLKIERDPQKSFIGFVFKNIKEGMSKAIL